MPHFPKKVYFLAALTVLLGITASYLQYSYKNRFPKDFKITPTTSWPSTMALISASPYKSNLDTTRPQFTFTFTQPVTAHHVAEYISISPEIKGEFTQGSVPNQIYFKPTTPFPPGSTVQIKILAGLPSDSGKKLEVETKFTYFINHDASAIVFAHKDWNGKFMSFAQSDGALLTPKFGSDIEKPRVRVFAATSNLLLNSLRYQTSPDSLTRIGDISGAFVESPIDITGLRQVKEYTDIQNGADIHFTSPAGIYLFQGLDGDVVLSNVWVTLNKSGIHFRQDDKNIYLAAQDLATTQPTSGFEVDFYSLHDSPKLIAHRTLAGLQQYAFPIEDRLDLIVAKKDTDVLIIPVQVPNSQANIPIYRDLDKSYQIFVYTDRPIYRPGTKVSFRGLVRKDNDALYQTTSLPQTMHVYLSGDKSLASHPTVSSTGTFYGEIDLPASASARTYFLYAETEGSKSISSESTYFDVSQYTKPAIDLTASIPAPEYTRGAIIPVTISANLFSGGPLANESVSYSIYKRDFYETEKAVYNTAFNLNNWGGMCGGGFDLWGESYGTLLQEEKSLTLDGNGQAIFDLDTQIVKPGISQELTVVAQKIDSTGQKVIATKSVIVHQGAFNIFIRPGLSSATSGIPYSVTFYAETAAGQKISDTKFKYELIQEVWEGRNSTRTPVTTGEITTDSSGTGRFEVTHSPSKDVIATRYLTISGTDSSGNTVTTEKYLPFYPISNNPRFSNQTVLKITSSSANLTPSTSATLDIVSPADMMVLLTFERGRVYKPQWLSLKAGKNTFSFPVTDNFAPSISPTFSFFWQGVHHLESLSLNVPAMHKLITVTATSDKTTYQPGDTAQVTITTTDPSGSPVSADLGIGVVDKAIYALRKNATPPLHSSFYYFRPRNTNSSSSMAWIFPYDMSGGKGGGGGSDSLLAKDSDTLYWNPTQKTDSSGQYTFSFPVGSTQTTWRMLVYASSEDTYLGQTQLDFQVRK